MDNPRLKPEEQDINLIGVKFRVEGYVWVVKTSGIKDRWGCESTRTSAFSTFDTEEIQKNRL